MLSTSPWLTQLEILFNFLMFDLIYSHSQSFLTLLIFPSLIEGPSLLVGVKGLVTAVINDT